MTTLTRAAIFSFIKAHCDVVEQIPQAFKVFESHLRGAYKVKHGRSTVEFLQEGVEHTGGGFHGTLIDLGHQERIVLYHMDMTGSCHIAEIPWESVRAMQIRYATLPTSSQPPSVG